MSEGTIPAGDDSSTLTPEEIKRKKRREYLRRYRSTDESRKRRVEEQRRYLDRHPEQRRKLVEYARRRYRENPERARLEARVKGNVRRARKRGSAVGTDREAYKAFDKRMRAAPRVRCYWCGKAVPKGRRVLDHVIPLARGGADDVYNLCCSCVTCNSRKWSYLPEEFSGQHVIVFGLSVATGPAPEVNKPKPVPQDIVELYRRRTQGKRRENPGRGRKDETRLTPTQEDAVWLKGLGMNNQQISKIMGVSFDRVRRIFRFVRKKVANRGKIVPLPTLPL